MGIKQRLLECLGQAGAIEVDDSPLLGNFPSKFQNGYLEFNWETEEGIFEVLVDEDQIDEDQSTFKNGVFTLCIFGKENVTIVPYKLVKFN